MNAPLLLPEVQTHFEDLIQNPSKPIDADLLDRFGLQLNENVDSSIVQDLILSVAALIPSTHNDASPLAKLGTQLVTISKLRFSDFATLDSNLDLTIGLKLPLRDVSLLVLAIIGKAAESPSEAALVAGKPELVATLVRFWLQTQDTALASKALKVLLSLLETDQEPKHGTATDAMEPLERSGSSKGLGLMWRRVFGDKNIYETVYSTCSLSNAGQPGQLTAREKSIAQGRLMDFITKVAKLDWAAATQPQFPEIESRYGVQDGGLLEFTTCHMVDATDALSNLTLIQFFTDLLDIPPEDPSFSPESSSAATNYASPALEFLISKKLHSNTISLYLDPSKHDPFVVKLLSGPASHYLAKYCTTFPKHLLERSSGMASEILDRIGRAFDIAPSAWGQQNYPRDSLRVLASLPRVLLIQESRSASPLLMLPTRSPNANVFKTLATIFHGPVSSTTSQDDRPIFLKKATHEDPTSDIGEAAAARVLYLLYLNRHPDMWANIVAAADSIALKDSALAAIRLIEAVMTAGWGALPATQNNSNTPYSLPTEETIRMLGILPQEKMAQSGLWAILVPPALNTVVPYLFKAPPNFAGMSRGSSDGSAVYEVATAKYDVLVILRNSLQELKVKELEEVLQTVGRRVTQGPWPSSARPGERVETMELS